MYTTVHLSRLDIDWPRFAAARTMVPTHFPTNRSPEHQLSYRSRHTLATEALTRSQHCISEANYSTGATSRKNSKLHTKRESSAEQTNIRTHPQRYEQEVNKRYIVFPPFSMYCAVSPREPNASHCRQTYVSMSAGTQGQSRAFRDIPLKQLSRCYRYRRT